MNRTATVFGEPVRIAMCHCLACQQRTGSVFSVQARVNAGDVKISGASHTYERVAKSGNRLSLHFCATDAATVHYKNTGWPGLVGVHEHD